MRNKMMKTVANKIAFLNDRSIAKVKCFFASKLNTKWFCFICNLEHSIEINLSFGFQRTNNILFCRSCFFISDSLITSVVDI